MMLYDKIAAYVPCNAQEAADRALMLAQLGRYDDLLFRSNPVMHFTASGWVVDPARERVLMVYHNIYQSWSWTGGHADGDENLLSVAMREVREETGIDHLRPISSEIFSLEILGVKAHVRRTEYVNTHLHLNLTYLFEADPAEPLRVKHDENSAVAWLPVSEVLDRCSEPEMCPVYRKLMEKVQDFPHN